MRTATEWAAAIRSGEISAREALDHHLDLVARRNPEVNAVVTLAAERARERAEQADAALVAGDVWGPLHGVPMTVKDSFETAGIRTTAGSASLLDHIPEANATALQRLVDAGVVVFGKTNLPEWAADIQTFNEPFGTTVNPHDTDRTPGGSSGGAVAALATGMTPIELGSDIGGSIRTPASWTGVFGHKPSHGIVPLRGHIPGPPGTRAEPDLAVAGPMARSAVDLQLMLGVLAGPADPVAKAWSLELPPARKDTPAGLRLATWLDDPDYPVDSRVVTALKAAADRMSDAGAQVSEATPVESMPALFEMYFNLLIPVTTAGLPRSLFEAWAREAVEGFDDGDPSVAVKRPATIHHRTWMAVNERRTRLRDRVERFFEDVDVLLAPAIFTPAIEHNPHGPFYARTIDGRSYLDVFAWAGLATVCHLPATVVPVGTTPEGLPVGMQIIGPYLEDHTTLKVARLLEEELGFEALTA